MADKAPGSGGPAAGNPAGVKSGAALLEEIKQQVKSPTPDAVGANVAPAEQVVRGTNADGSANPDVETSAEEAGIVTQASQFQAAAAREEAAAPAEPAPPAEPSPAERVAAEANDKPAHKPRAKRT